MSTPISNQAHLSAHASEPGLQLSLSIGDHVRHKQFTGVLHGLQIDHEQVLMADVVLDAPIVIPPGDGFNEIRIHRQSVPAHELRAFDERDEQIARLSRLAQRVANLNPKAGTIGDGMLASLVEDARRALGIREEATA